MHAVWATCLLRDVDMLGCSFPRSRVALGRGRLSSEGVGECRLPAPCVGSSPVRCNAEEEGQRGRAGSLTLRVPMTAQRSTLGPCADGAAS